MKPTNCCPDDEALLYVFLGDPVDEAVSAHLSDCPLCQQHLNRLRSAIGDLRQTIQRTKTYPPLSPPFMESERAGKRPAAIGKYLVVGELDSGGQALVYRALHPLLGKDVAIKWGRTPADLETADQDRLVAEGRLLAELEHPNLARVFDLDFHEGRPFLAMEYVRGRDLHGYVRQQRLPPRQAARIVADVAQAVAAAHRRGITHLDITPRNIILAEDGRPRLIDFGLAHLRHAWGESATAPTGGTPAFMAPEQARGEVESIGPSSDIFALGGVLYYLLTGQAPFAADFLQAALDRAGRGDFDRTALRRAGVPRRLESICLKAMAPQPADRYARAEEVAEELQHYLSAPSRWARAGLALAAALLIGLGAWWLARPAPPPRAPFVSPVAELHVEVERDGQYLDLPSALPLHAGTDKVQVVAKVPPHLHVALLYLDPRGKVKRLPARMSSADTFTRLVFPGEGRLAPLEADAPGTELVLVCAAASAPPLEELEELVASILSPPLPPLPPNVFVRLTRDEPHRQSKSFGPVEADPVAQVEAKLDRLRQRLRDKGVSVIQGVAFSH